MVWPSRSGPVPNLATLCLLAVAAFVAGFLDAVVGGGGLVTIPALLIGLPGAPVTTLLGTNKVVSFTGTSVALLQFVRSREPRLEWGWRSWSRGASSRFSARRC